MSKLFSLNDRKLLESDASYWERSLSHALALLKTTKAESEDDLETRAVVLGQIAGITLAMNQHYGSALNHIGYSGHAGVVTGGLKAYDSAMAHSKSMAVFAEKNLS